MKKLFRILIVAALLLTVLAGCQSADTSLPQGTPPATTQPQDTLPLPETMPEVNTPQLRFITPEEAKNIALQDAALAEVDVRDLEVELDLDDGAVHYDVDFEKGQQDYDYDIDAVTGQILRVEKSPAETAPEVSIAGADYVKVFVWDAATFAPFGFDSEVNNFVDLTE